MGIRTIQLPNGQLAYVDDYGRMCDNYGNPLPSPQISYQQPAVNYNGMGGVLPQVANGMSGGNMMYANHNMQTANQMVNVNQPVVVDPYQTTSIDNSGYRSRSKKTAQTQQPVEPVAQKQPEPSLEETINKGIKQEYYRVLTCGYLVSPGGGLVNRDNGIVDFINTTNKFIVKHIETPLNKSTSSKEVFINALKVMQEDPVENTLYVMDLNVANVTFKHINIKSYAKHPFNNPAYDNLGVLFCLGNAVNTINILGSQIGYLTNGDTISIDTVEDIDDFKGYIKSADSGLSARDVDYLIKATDEVINMYSNLLVKEPVQLTPSMHTYEMKADIADKTVIFSNKVLNQFLDIVQIMVDKKLKFVTKVTKYSFPELYTIMLEKIKKSNKLFLDFVLVGILDDVRSDDHGQPTLLTIRVVNPLKYFEYTETSDPETKQFMLQTLNCSFVAQDPIAK